MKTIQMIKNNRYKILTPTGFEYFSGMQKNRKQIIHFICKNGISCKVSNNHEFVVNNNVIKANTLKIGDYLEHKKYKKLKIIKIKYKKTKNTYDLINVNNGNIFYGNNILHHNCKFIGSTNTIINAKTIKILLTSWSEPSYYDLNDRLFIYEKPEEGSSYVIGGDPAKGTGENSSTIQILKIIKVKPVKIKQVAVFKDNLTDVYDYTDIISKLSYYYNNAYIMCESNGEGSAVVNRLWWELENPNLVNTGSKSKNLGIRATKYTKTRAVLLMKKLLEDGSIILFDRNTIEELGSYIEENNKFFGKDKPDDLVSALYWAIYILEMGILDDNYEFKKEKDDNVDSWGLLSDVNENLDDWQWLNDSNVYDS